MTLHNFNNDSLGDGSDPEAGLVQGTDGNFYGTTYFGGTNPNGTPRTGGVTGTVFKITPAGVAITLHSFNGYYPNVYNDGANPDALLIQGNDGNFYGTTYVGGSNGWGTVFQITASGGESVLTAFPGYGPLGGSVNPTGPVVQGGDGNFYGTTPYGGNSDTYHPAGYGSVFSVTPDGALTVIHWFTSNDGMNPNTGLVNSGDGNFYGTTYYGGSTGYGTIFKITPAGTLTTLYTFTGGTDGSNPGALTLASDGNLYGTTPTGGDWGLGSIFRLTLTVPPETVKPTNTITAPVSSQRWSNSVFTVTGTARDNVAVFKVWYQLNSSGWNLAASTNSWTNWTAGVMLTPGTNIVQAFAVDTSGNKSITNSVSFDFVMTNQLQVQMTGRGTISPNYSNAWLDIGRNYSITSTPASGFVFTNWVVSTNWIGGAIMTKTNLQFIMASNLTLQANFVDTNKPAVSITNLTAGQRVSNAVFTVRGTASDNWQVSNVLCQINGGGWNLATNINNWTNWTAKVTLIPGTNVVQAFAVDTSGNVSTTNSVSFQYVASAPLQVQMTGLGTVSPNYSNAVLAIGQSYSMTATQGTGFVFTNWTGGTNLPLVVLTNKAALQFVMQSNLVLQANFVDTNKPAVSITNLVSGQRVSNAVFTVKGTAGDNWQVSNVVCQINGGGWNLATNINNWTNWAAGVTLMPGTNVVQARAVDTSGNVSTTNSVSFQYVLSAPLQVQITGLGTVSPNYSNAVLAIGQSYSMTATAGTGNVFINWTGGTNLPLVVLTNKAALQFVMQSNLVLQANFVNTNRVVTFTNTPATVSNTYPGTITLQIGGLTNKETVVVQKFLDLNTNGVIDGGDLLVRQFTLQDGTNFVIGGVTNFNVPGDLNAATGAITATLNFQGGDLMQKIVGRYLYKLSSPAGHFAPLTNQFAITNFPFPQWITGNVVSNNTSTGVSNAVVVVLTAAQGVGVAGTVANNAGSYTIAVPPGAYSLLAFKSNYIANMGTPPVVTLTNTQTVTTNLTLTGATSSISGKIVDANNQAIGLPGVFIPAKGNDGLVAVTFTDTNGNFNVRVTAGGWNIKPDDSSLIVHGYLGLQNGTNVNAGATGVTQAVHKATALFYGSVKDNLGNPFVGLVVYTDDGNGNGLYEADGYTDANGNYVVGVLGLGNTDSWWVGANVDDVITNYVFSQENGNANININAGQAVLQNFTGLLATNYITGEVKDNDGNPIVGVGVNANANNGTNYQTHVDTDDNGYYSLNVANGSWNVSINCNGGDDSLQNLGNYECPNNQTITIYNNNGLANFTVQTNLNVGGTLQVTTAAVLPYGIVGTAYDQQLTADGGQANTSYSWSVISNSLPPGLSMDSGGTIQGTPTLSGTTNFTVQVRDNNGSMATQALSLTIYAPLQVTTTSLSSGTTNVPYNSQQLTASGGQPPYVWSLASGLLPPGLSLSTNGVISGTPTVAGTSNFVVRVTDSAMGTATQALSLVVSTISTSVTFAVTPAAVSNFYNGIVTLQVGGLTNGETVLVEKFRDNNGNGVIDTWDTEVQQFQLTDGQASVFYDGTTAVTNFNVPGDLTPADGAITAHLHPALGGQLTVAQYVFKLSSPVGHFAPLTNLFNVTNSAYAQSFTGNVVCSGTNVPHALACLFTPSSTAVIASTLADGTGAYHLSAPPGTYLLCAFKSGFVGDTGTGPVLALGTNATITTNLSLLPATCNISGRFVDAANTNAGLPCVLVKGGSADGLATVGFADGNGNFTLPATTNWWAVWGDSLNLDSQGFLGLQSPTIVNASVGSVTGVVISLPKGTAIFYGSVKDGQNNPLPGVKLFGYNGGGPYAGDATTDQNGDYVVAVNNGVWHAHIDYAVPSYVNYIFSSGLADTNIVDGEAVLQNLVGLLATNQITGYVIDGNHHPIGSVGVGGSADINGYDFAAPSVLTDSNGFYSLMVANGDWSVHVSCSEVPNNTLKSFGYACINDQATNIFNNNGVVNFTPMPIPILGSPAWNLGRFQMQLRHSITGQNYTVQMSTNLSSPNWTSLFITNNALTNSFLVTDPNTTNNRRFYRVKVGP